MNFSGFTSSEILNYIMKIKFLCKPKSQCYSPGY